MPHDAYICHIGVAFYTHRDFPTQWALVLSENSLFEGRVWCSNVAETMNGWCVSWTPRDWSPAAGSAFDPAEALFLGVVYVAQIFAPINSVQAWLAERNFASELDRFQVHAPDDIPYGPEKYVVLALWRLREARFINFRKSDLKSLADKIGSRLLILQHAQLPPANTLYPVVPLENDDGKISFGRFMVSCIHALVDSSINVRLVEYRTLRSINLLHGSDNELLQRNSFYCPQDILASEGPWRSRRRRSTAGSSQRDSACSSGRHQALFVFALWSSGA